MKAVDDLFLVVAHRRSGCSLDAHSCCMADLCCSAFSPVYIECMICFTIIIRSVAMLSWDSKYTWPVFYADEH